MLLFGVSSGQEIHQGRVTPAGVQNLLGPGVTGAERTVEFEVVHVVEETATDWKYYPLKSLETKYDNCFFKDVLLILNYELV